MQEQITEATNNQHLSVLFDFISDICRLMAFITQPCLRINLYSAIWVIAKATKVWYLSARNKNNVRTDDLTKMQFL